MKMSVDDHVRGNFLATCGFMDLSGGKKTVQVNCSSIASHAKRTPFSRRTSRPNSSARSA